jgi:hypothetical protein
MLAFKKNFKNENTFVGQFQIQINPNFINESRSLIKSALKSWSSRLTQCVVGCVSK